MNKLSYSTYCEIYYSYDFSNPQNHEKPSFVYNHKRHNEVNTNLMYAKANYKDKNLLANLGLMAGNYPQYNLIAEPSWAQFVYEANIGVKLSNKHNIWLNAGIMPSHIGFESAVSADCWTLTRSILADNSPYYETGLKTTFTNKKQNFNFSFLLLNGWQCIKKPDYIQKPSFGTQINYQPNEKIIFNYSNFIGTMKPDSQKSLRTYHNFYFQFDNKHKFGAIAGFDIGTDKYNAYKYGYWYSPILIMRYAINKKIIIALRSEYFFDKKQILIQTKTINGFQVAGFSTNLDYKINNNALFRIEGKIYDSKDKIFGDNSKNNYSLTTNLTVKF